MRCTEKNKWKLSKEGKLDSIKRYNTWIYPAFPPDKDAVRYSVVLARKMDEQVRIACYKASLVTKGYGQKDGIDYDETLARVILFHVLFLMVGKHTSVGLHAHHDDNSTALMNEVNDDELYGRWNHKCYKLQKSLCGLKQFLHLRHEELKNTLGMFGLKQVKS